jgi:hypothetical protein
MTTFSKKIARRVVYLLAAAIFAAPLAGCDNFAPLLGAIGLMKNYATMSDEKKAELFNSTFGPGTDPALRTTVMNGVYGDNLAYVSPEQQAGFFANYSAFMYGVGPAIASVMDISVYATPGDSFYDFLQALKDYYPILLADLKAQNDAVVTERLAAIKKRTKTKDKDFFPYLTPTQVRDIIWDNAKFNAFMTDPVVAKDEILVGLGHQYTRDQRSSMEQSVLTDFYAPLLIPTGQPPS